jgi:outer membrane protein
LSVLHHQLAAARNQAESDSRLRRPTVNAIGLGGFLPAGDPRLRSRYGGVALTMTVPIFNGHILEARKQESLARALVVEKQRQDFLLQLGASVRLALLHVETARKNIDVSRRLQEHAERTLRLSETRYTAGLGTILEFNQAQVDAATAKLAYASARYAAGMRLARLDFEVGNLQ